VGPPASDVDDPANTENVNMAPRQNNRSRSGGNSYDNRDSHQEQEYITKVRGVDSLSEISIEEIAKEDGIAEMAAKNFKGLKTTQLRRIFDAVKKIESDLADKSWSDVEAEFHMLRPLIAYAKGRNLIPNNFYTLITIAMQKVPVGDDDQKKKNYRIFVKLLESIVAYHKYYNSE